MNLLPVDQGASILLTWVINFLKWSTGHGKFGPDANKNAGAAEGLSSNGLLNKMDQSITNNDEFLSHHGRQEEDSQFKAGKSASHASAKPSSQGGSMH